MSVTLRCPHCQEELIVPADPTAGQLRCHGCRQIVEAPEEILVGSNRRIIASPPNLPNRPPALPVRDTAGATPTERDSNANWFHVHVIPTMLLVWNGISVAVMWLAREVKLVVIATRDLLIRLTNYAVALRKVHVLRKQKEQAQLALGEQLLELGFGDESQRTELASLNRKIENPDLHANIRLTAEKKRIDLLGQLVEEAMATDAVPEQAETSRQKLVDVANAVTNQQDCVKELKADLFGSGPSSFVRTAIGCTTIFIGFSAVLVVPIVICCAFFAVSLFISGFGSVESNGGSGEVAEKKPKVRITSESIKEPISSADKEAENVEIVDLRADMIAAGFVGGGGIRGDTTISRFIHYGNSKQVPIEAINTWYFELTPQVRLRKEQVKKQFFFLTQRNLSVLNRDEIVAVAGTSDRLGRNNLLLKCFLPFRASIRDPVARDREIRRKPDIWSSYTHTDDWDGTWYLTKKGTLKACRNAADRVYIQQNNGIGYNEPLSGHSSLVIKLNVDLPTAKRITSSKNLEKSCVDIVISDLTYGQYTWGFYRSDFLAAHLYDCEKIRKWSHIGLSGGDPRAPSFMPGKGQREGAQARILALALRDKDGKAIYSFSSGYEGSALPSVRKLLWVSPLIGETSLRHLSSNYIDVERGDEISIRGTHPSIKDGWIKVAIGEPNESPLQVLTVTSDLKFRAKHTGKLYLGFYKADVSSWQKNRGMNFYVEVQ